MLQACKDNGVLLMDGTFWVHHARVHGKTNLLPKITLLEINSLYLTKDTFTSVRATFNWPGFDPNNIRCNPALEPTGSLGDMAWYSCGVSLWVTLPVILFLKI
jgi:hypothetical protein